MPTHPNLDEVAAILRRHLPSADYRAVLFGSRASEAGRRQGPGSDWDIGILGPVPLRGSVLERIRCDLEELRTLHTFDVVDLTATPAEFRATAMRSHMPLT